MNQQFLTPELIKLVARKAMVPLALLVVVGGAIHYATSEFEQDNLQLGFAIGAAEWEISETVERIATIDQELGIIREKGRRYDQILQTGFIEPQNRLFANQLLEELSEKYEIESLTYSFEPARVTEARGLNGIEFDVMRTEISMEISAHADSDIAGFVAEFVYRLQGQVQILALDVARKEPITNELMQRIAARGAAGAFAGTLSLIWNNADTDLFETSGDTEDES